MNHKWAILGGVAVAAVVVYTIKKNAAMSSTGTAAASNAVTGAVLQPMGMPGQPTLVNGWYDPTGSTIGNFFRSLIP